ncbi:MAG: RNA polymerase sigma factor [Candidatus Abyssobacteria bacterium SURF_5]|uniref:RNA polymerase sigma factor n=1 Tax=Abyssobacteria bacterium (strain SURF_5) TaxID=2093360 RepID=A0A3A4NN38_ABYX5|nr:MAG: RNA polymerase sigma factor [Candidatus Abyssubacteria bacterium SURF_5]
MIMERRLDQDIPDEALMLQYAGGDLAAFEELLERHRNPLFAYLCRMLGNRESAEDVFQEVFLRIVCSRRRYRERAKFSTWLYKIAHNSCIDMFRREKYRRAESLHEPIQGKDGEQMMPQDFLASGNPGPDELLQRRQISEALKNSIDRLAPEQREVFVLRQYQDLSFREIAKIVQTSESTVKSRMRYALKNLRDMLVEQRVIEEVTS